MRIKKHPSGNEYMLAGNVWVRNPIKENLVPLQISDLFKKEDHTLILENQEMNKNFAKISDEKIFFKKVVIISDGYKFQERHTFLKSLPRDVCILATNGALKGWTLMSNKVPASERRSLNAYVLNNPYPDAIQFMPERTSKYYPVCIASNRANYAFLKKYLGDVYLYCPTPEEGFGLSPKETYYIDDYRNPICAALGLAYKFGAEKVLLMCCDDSFEEKRNFAVQLENGLWTYPHHLRAHEFIDATMKWMRMDETREISFADFSGGPKYKNAVYITEAEAAIEFFRDGEEETNNAKKTDIG